TQSRLTGLGMAQGIQYSGLAAVNIRLGTGGDTFTVASTHTGTTFVAAGPGDDTVDVQSTSGPTTIDAGAGNDQVPGGGGSLSAITTATGAPGPAPLVLIGGAGHGSLIVDDSADTATGETGN